MEVVGVMGAGEEKKNLREKGGETEIKYKKHIDLRGTVCPMNIVVAKREISKMNPGDVVRITVDFPAAKHDVPRSLERDGHEVIKVEDKGNYADIFVRV